MNDCPLNDIDKLARDLYEGSPALANLAEKLARIYGKADALTFYEMMGDDVQNFWKGIARQLINHAKHWLPNDGCGCVLDVFERDRLALASRVQPSALPPGPEVTT